MWFVKYQLLKLDLTPEYIIKESNFVMKYIKLAIHNESPWNYLRGLFLSSGKGRFCQYPQVRERERERERESKRDKVSIVYLLTNASTLYKSHLY